MGTFDGIQIGSTGLGAQRRGVETAGQNIANVNTEGYTRQRVDITADSGPITPAFHSTWTASGLGVRSVEVSRLRDAFVDSRLRNESARAAELTARATAYRSIERIFDEPGDTGLAAVMADFLAAWDDLANSPGDIGARTQVVERGVTLADDINQIGAALDALRDANRTALETTIAQVNADAAQVATLQEAIMSARAAGTNANELQDQRDLLLERIVTAVGGTVRHEDDGTATLLVGGTAVVRGDRAAQLEVREAADGTASVVWALDGRDAGVAGESAGLLHVVNELVPDQLAQLDGVADSLRTIVNDIHRTGWDGRDPSNTGTDFFVGTGRAISVDDVIRQDPRAVAAAGAAGTLDGSIAAAIAASAGIDQPYRELIVRLGVESQSAHRRVQLQTDVVAQVRAEQEAANGVNLDEELSDLVRFQRAYEASSRFLSAVDEILDTLINGTGRVGR